MNNYELRTNPGRPHPPIAVIDMRTNVEIAYFFSIKRANAYVQWLNGPAKNKRPHPLQSKAKRYA